MSTAVRDSEDLVANIPVLTPQEAANVRAGVYAHRPWWRQRHNEYPFFTLGAASYLDARDAQFKAYQAQAQASNAVLFQQFGWVLERLRHAVMSLVGGDAAYDERLALPGFHVFLFGPALQHPTASRHFDLQYELIDWTDFGTPDVSAQISLTLSIALPVCGAGLLVWNIDRRQLETMTPAERLAYGAANRLAMRQPYAVGHLIAHSGYQLHQIAPEPDLQPGDARITLQAHALPLDGRWVIYW